MSEQQRSTRPRYPMPPFVEAALTQRALMEAYRSRPPYQQNDYIGWLTRARQPATRQRRLEQMLDELSAGDAYMRMPYHRAGVQQTTRDTTHVRRTSR
jgi:uncharacterized protein YdeI (YjbR/CyaY-like superfamily)